MFVTATVLDCITITLAILYFFVGECECNNEENTDAARNCNEHGKCFCLSGYYRPSRAGICVPVECPSGYKRDSDHRCVGKK